MKIVAWNCNMAFRKKARFILALQPDILVVPECEHPDRLRAEPTFPQPHDCLWVGSNPNKGLGILSYGPYKLTLLDIHNPQLKLVAPVAVKGKNSEFLLFAVWANNPGDPDGQYVEQVWKAIHHYDRLLDNKKIILAGDFNSNTIWDRPRRKGNHSAVVEYLEKKGIQSVYHHYYKQAQGKEEHPTQYLYRHRDKPYHLDYCFISRYFSKRLVSVEIGNYDDWIAYSDHMPVVATFA